VTHDRNTQAAGAANAIGDADARAQALDPSRSFIVQAPAGSGKTELLIQRFLVLLAVVERPEEVLAITFTRKAAGEMKRRVLDALARSRRVDAGAEPAPEGPNERMTLDLARRALARNAAQGWRIEENTARLRIQTIDGLCASLTRQMPVLARFGAQPRSVEDARELHREAAHRTLALLESGAFDEAGGLPAQVARVLEHLDNNANLVEGLIATMLARRDQWLRTAGSAPDRDALEAALAAERTRVLREASRRMPPEQAAELVALGAYAAANLDAAGTPSPITACADLATSRSADESGAAAWTGLAAMLLTREGEWRRKIDKRGGFPAGDSKAEKAIAKAWKDRHAALCAALADAPGLRDALAEVQRMPPARYSEAQWSALSAIVALLPMAAAQLKLVFAERGEVDFTEVAQGAVRALGEPDAPTDLLLSFDVRLRHILVDEFQDTSISQFELIERLTAGWLGNEDEDTPDDDGSVDHTGDGRTLFLVGDPMQSIYRFREAEVALFLRARRQGLGSLRLTPLTLSTNFRSQAGVIDWVNGAFARVFPPADDEASGAVGFAASTAFHAALAGEAVRWHVFAHDGSPDARAAAREAEARRVARLVHEARAEKPDASVAILVRSRAHLASIVPALKAAGLAFRAIDIEQLHEKQVVQDLLALTRALAHPGDRVAWLACLRAPWCGLTLADLLGLSTDEAVPPAADAGVSRAAPVILDALADAARLDRLSADGRVRVARVSAVFAAAVAERLRGTLRDRVEGTWLALGGPACVDNETELEDAAMFLDMLDTLDDGGDVADSALLEEHLDQLYALPDLSADDSLQVMTIHKSKGLEFDTVILPGLDRSSRVNEPPLLQWKLRRAPVASQTASPAGSPPAMEEAFHLLLAPIKQAGEADEPIGGYLARLAAAEEEAESARLLYVAVTRAADRLHLLATATVREEEGAPGLQAPSVRSLLSRCWPVAEPEFAMAVREGGAGATGADDPASSAGRAASHGSPANGNSDSHFGARLPASWTPPAPPPAADWPRAAATRAGDAPEFEWVSDTLRHVGTVVHRWLQRMADDQLAGWDVTRIEGLRQAFRRELAARGVAEAELASAVTRVRAALVNALDDPRGRWLLGPQRDGRNELRITARLPAAREGQSGGLATVVIDRSFRDAEGRIWIVDYKTSHHEGAGVEAFLDREQLRYREQLQRYALALAAPEASLGLYFPLLRGWREWGGGSEEGRR
jgi:ATP-dependent helicase/nuclease subunit A